MMNVNYKELIKGITNTWNIRDEFKSMDLDEVKTHQPKLPFSVCLCNVTGDLNLGNIIRSAVIFGASDVFILGRTKMDRRSTVGAENYINIHKADMLLDEMTIDYDKAINFIINTGYQPVFVEKHDRGIHYNRIPLNYNPCFMFGNEGLGIPDSILDKYNTMPIVSIEQRGVMRSLNVSVAAGIILNNFSERYMDFLDDTHYF